MSDGKNNSILKGSMDLKDILKLLAWIVGLVVLSGLFWSLSQPARNRNLQRAVNRVLEQSGDSIRLESPIPLGANETVFSGMGSWFTITEVRAGERLLPEGSRAFVFAFVAEGIFFPCAALVEPGGKVEEFIPLNTHAEKMLKQVPAGILTIYARRIEEGEL